MDTTKTVTHVSLCAGYGGIDLGLKRAIPSLRTVAFSEIEAFACANLVSKMEAGLLDPAPIWTNLKTFPWSEFRDRVDILSGGYPCQPFSAAGKRLGTEDPRHLWPFIADGIRAMRPRLCFFENVEGHISLGLRAVIEELAGIGYETTWGIFSASEVGAPHQRKRVFILAHRSGEGLEGFAGHELLRHEPRWDGEGQDGLVANPCILGDAWPSRPGEPQYGWEPPRVVGNAPQLFGNGGNDHAGSGQQRGPVSEPRDASGESAVAHARGARADALPEEVRSRDDSAGEPGAVGESAYELLNGSRTSPRQAGCPEHPDTGGWQAEPPLGGDADGSPGGMGYAELCITSDNRTDELRLLGNGVVPAVATKAFITLASELFSLDNPTHTNNDNQIRQ